MHSVESAIEFTSMRADGMRHEPLSIVTRQDQVERSVAGPQKPCDGLVAVYIEDGSHGPNGSNANSGYGISDKVFDRPVNLRRNSGSLKKDCPKGFRSATACSVDRFGFQPIIGVTANGRMVAFGMGVLGCDPTNDRDNIVRPRAVLPCSHASSELHRHVAIRRKANMPQYIAALRCDRRLPRTARLIRRLRKRERMQ
jgi:hypothetical protein